MASPAPRASGNTRPQRPIGGAANKVGHFKLVLLGESAVGKSSLVLRFVKGQFHEYQESTIGAAYFTHRLVVDGGVLQAEIWDTAGQERYNSLAPMYYRGAQAAIVMYDIASAPSFQRARAWARELQQQASPGIVVAIAGNKADLEADRQVATEEAQAFAEENGFLFLETSAKTGQNVSEVFHGIARVLPRGEQPAASHRTRGRVLDEEGHDKHKSCCSK